jgi:hypothetical protein
MVLGASSDNLTHAAFVVSFFESLRPSASSALKGYFNAEGRRDTDSASKPTHWSQPGCTRSNSCTNGCHKPDQEVLESSGVTPSVETVFNMHTRH